MAILYTTFFDLESIKQENVFHINASCKSGDNLWQLPPVNVGKLILRFNIFPFRNIVKRNIIIPRIQILI